LPRKQSWNQTTSFRVRAAFLDGCQGEHGAPVRFSDFALKINEIQARKDPVRLPPHSRRTAETKDGKQQAMVRPYPQKVVPSGETIDSSARRPTVCNGIIVSDGILNVSKKYRLSRLIPPGFSNAGT